MMNVQICLSVLLIVGIGQSFASTYTFSDGSGLGRSFDGIGGLSGGGATSKLLVNYKEPQRSEILDLLFKPGYAASLQILKVEIGGDDQSTDGGEASHQHEENDENYNRGYEWWLMKEAKKRNPSIKLYALPWTFPGWLGEGTQSPYTNRQKTADYVTRWIKAARDVHNLAIDYIGIWNERDADLDYVLILLDTLKHAGFDKIGVISNDAWMLNATYEPYINNKTLFDAVYAFGVHYPGTETAELGQSSGKRLWSSEDYSTFNDNVGAGCWARTCEPVLLLDTIIYRYRFQILVQNYVNGLMTSTISWNLIASYYLGLPFELDGLMTAVQPWSGHYVINNPIWVSAHFTQFTSIGWTYLAHGTGVGHLDGGGSYVALTNPQNTHLTIIIEKMSHDHSICIRPPLAPYDVSHEKPTIQLDGSFAKIKKLYVWRTMLKFDGSETVALEYGGAVDGVDGSFIIQIEVDTIYTLTTVQWHRPAPPQHIPASTPFPLPYYDDFEKYALHSEQYYLTPQTGMWEVLQDGTNKFIRQMVTQHSVSWCPLRTRPIAVIGDENWEDVSVSASVRVPTNSTVEAVFLGARSNSVGCNSERNTRGVYVWLFPSSSSVAYSSDFDQTELLHLSVLPVDFTFDQWHNVSLTVSQNLVSASFDGHPLGNGRLFSDQPQQGFVAIGSYGFGHSDWDNLSIKNVDS